MRHTDGRGSPSLVDRILRCVPAAGRRGRRGLPTRVARGERTPRVENRFGYAEPPSEPSFKFHVTSSQTESCWTMEDGLHFCHSKFDGWESVLKTW